MHMIQNHGANVSYLDALRRQLVLANETARLLAVALNDKARVTAITEEAYSHVFVEPTFEDALKVVPNRDAAMRYHQLAVANYERLQRATQGHDNQELLRGLDAIGAPGSRSRGNACPNHNATRGSNRGRVNPRGRSASKVTPTSVRPGCGNGRGRASIIGLQSAATIQNVDVDI